MRSLNNGAGLVFFIHQFNFHIQLVRIKRPSHVHISIFHKMGRSFNVFRAGVIHNPELAVHRPAHSTQSSRIIYSSIVRSGYPRRHRVLDDIRAGPDLDMLQLSIQLLSGNGGCQRNRGRLCAAGGQHHLMIQYLTNQFPIHSDTLLFYDPNQHLILQKRNTSCPAFVDDMAFTIRTFWQIRLQ